ncbi:uncharacterized protein [Aristolochia californica]|uniref:uncharacterized protein n=1 Tax=Aristolochia californica TaxID=171875 RepID=UPI0035E325AB
MVVVVRLTKYAHFVALKHPFTIVIVAKAFVAQVVRLHGIPQSIVSDREKGTSLRKWIEWVPWAEFSYNTSIHSSTKMTPFEAVYHLKVYWLIYQALLVASMKFAPRFFGPYKIIKKVGPVAYKLAFPPGSQIHDAFHVSLLRRHLGRVTPTSTQLPPVSDTTTVLPQSEKVLDRRVIQKGKYRPKSEILVNWVGAPAEDATWENEWRFTKSYPGFILVDKDS